MRTSSQQKVRTNSFQNNGNSGMKASNISRTGYSPGKSEDRPERQSDLYNVRFRRKDLRQFNPRFYVTANINEQDVLELKEVFDFYDSTGMGVLLPNDLKILLTENGFNPNKRTVYEIIAEFDAQQTGGISFLEFMKAMDTKPYINESKKDIMTVFKKYDRSNKGYLNLDDIREVNKHIKENLDQETMRLMVQRCDSNKDGKISFEDFYAVMVKNVY